MSVELAMIFSAGGIKLGFEAPPDAVLHGISVSEFSTRLMALLEHVVEPSQISARDVAWDSHNYVVDDVEVEQLAIPEIEEPHGAPPDGQTAPFRPAGDELLANFMDE